MAATASKHLVFVYNAKSGLGNSLMDGAHKILDPKTYACSLCAITHGAFTEKKRWKKFREESGLTMQFLYKDQFLKKYGNTQEGEVKFPVIFELVHGKLQMFLNAAAINALKDQEGLIQAIQELGV